jgi:hypothetical protein
MAKLNWWRANKLYGQKTLDYRYELDVPDRAEKWIAAVERHQRVRRIYAPPRRRTITLTSSEASR